MTKWKDEFCRMYGDTNKVKQLTQEKEIDKAISKGLEKQSIELRNARIKKEVEEMLKR